jgi:CheY-like chemotaxis protein
MRILIAEDNVVNLLVAQSLLNAEGAICETARDGAEAVQRWFTARHDLILMDCQMPGMDGYQATARIRSIEAVERCASVPILAITANAVIGDQEKCLAAGMNAYLAKPYSKDGLMFALKMAIARSPRVAGASKHIDLTRIYELRNAESQGAENLLARVAALFASSTPQLLRQLRECVERGDSSGIQAVAHKLKSSSAQVGAIRLSNTAVRIESTARLSGAGAVLMTDVEEAEVQFDQAASQLREIA